VDFQGKVQFVKNQVKFSENTEIHGIYELQNWRFPLHTRKVVRYTDNGTGGTIIKFVLIHLQCDLPMVDNREFNDESQC